MGSLYKDLTLCSRKAAANLSLVQRCQHLLRSNIHLEHVVYPAQGEQRLVLLTWLGSLARDAHELSTPMRASTKRLKEVVRKDQGQGLDGEALVVLRGMERSRCDVIINWLERNSRHTLATC
jgi:hypothetical protein